VFDEEVIEVHIITDEILSLYGKDIFITFKDFIRKEKKYKNAHELAHQLKEDRYTCMAN
jgi:FAD synthase